uniref:GTP binding protein Cdc42 n=1 Tax=Ganoderma boninense TaxID=34458 RepID=A0A5K1K7Y0_9APHY|nr:GTP binding protein Cdc42 [Ganoderma boninense]
MESKGAKEAIAHRPPITVFNSRLLEFCRRCQSRPDAPGSKVRLKRCTGCAEVAYCSKDCQKADWAHHKTRCLSVASHARMVAAPDDSAEGVAFREAFGRLGLSSERHQRRLLNEYLDVHEWALKALVKAVLYKNTKLGHTHWDPIAQRNKTILFVFKLNPALAGAHPERVDPARALLLQSHALVDFPATAAASAKWALRQPHRRPGVRLPPGRGHGLHELGLPPNRARAEPRLPMSDATLRALQAVTALCVETTRAGLPMGALSPSLGPTAATRPPGQFVWIRGVWRWRQLFETWADYRPGEHAEFDRVMEKLGPEFVENPGKMEHMIELFRQIPPRENM